MLEMWNGLVKAIELIVALDAEVIEVALRSLRISLFATSIASVICIPIGSLIHFHEFPGKRMLISITQTLFSVPTVIIGLFVFVLFSRAGPFGGSGLLFTPTIMVIGQAILITPLLIGMTVLALSGIEPAIPDTARALGANNFQVTTTLLKEARFAVMGAVIMGFGRAISEVGLALMVGGNIRGFTRIITTTISLETSKGNIELSIALGIILLAIALVINILLNRIQQR